MSKPDYYTTLGLTKTATDDDIKKAYRKLAMKYHPDRNPGDGSQAAEEKFKEAKEAYECLSNPTSRTAYDNHGHGGAPKFQHRQYTTDFNSSGMSKEDAEHIKEMFQDLFGQTRRQANVKRHTINISLEDAYIGKKLRLYGGLVLDIPAGSATGQTFYTDDGLYQVDITPHARFKRSHDDLLVEVDISYIEAILGLKAVLNHLDGAILQFTIPSGIQPGQVVRLAGKGMRNISNDRYGDLLVRINITIPKTISADDRSILEKLAHRDSINI